LTQSLGSHYCFSFFWDCGLKVLMSRVFKSIGSQCFIHFKAISGERSIHSLLFCHSQSRII
jgi:hypothetical protein